MNDVIVFAEKGTTVASAARQAIAVNARFFVHNDKVYRVAFEFVECGELLLDDWGQVNPSTIVRMK